MIKIEYDGKKDIIKLNDWQKESDMEEILTLLMILWDDVIITGRGRITDEILFQEMKSLEKIRLGGKEKEEMFEEHFTKASYTDLEKRNNDAIEYIKGYLEIDEETGTYSMPYTFDAHNLYKILKMLEGNDHE